MYLAFSRVLDLCLCPHCQCFCALLLCSKRWLLFWTQSWECPVSTECQHCGLIKWWAGLSNVAFPFSEQPGNSTSVLISVGRIPAWNSEPGRKRIGSSRQTSSFRALAKMCAERDVPNLSHIWSSCHTREKGVDRMSSIPRCFLS